MARVGWLTLQSSGRYEEFSAQGFIAGLHEAGFVQGKTLELVKRSADGDLRSLGPLAKEIVSERVDVFFAPAEPMTNAAGYAIRRIPTVVATVTDQVRADYPVPLTRPGKHITSVTTANAELIGKRLQLLTEMVPGARRVGTFIDPASLASCFEEVDLMGQSAKALGLSLLRIEVAACKDFDAEAALQRAVATKVQSVETELMTSDQDFTDRLAEESKLHRLPFVHDVLQLAG